LGKHQNLASTKHSISNGCDCNVIETRRQMSYLLSAYLVGV